MGSSRVVLASLSVGVGLLLQAGSASAACVPELLHPKRGSVRVNSPVFAWSGGPGCASYRVWFSPSGDFGGDSWVTASQVRDTLRLREETWDAHQASDWADGVSWKVEGLSVDGSIGYSDTWRFRMDPDLDDDGASQDAGGDCDDFDPDVRPGAAEVCDGLDDDCDGVPDDGCTGLGYGALIITEVMRDPTFVADAAGEWFEVYNATSTTVDLLGLNVTDLDTDGFVVGSSVPVAPGGFAVLGVNGDPGMNGWVAIDYQYSSFTLANGADEIVLTTSAGELVDDVAWDAGVEFPDPSGASMTLDPSLYDPAANSLGSSWCAAVSYYNEDDQGTPGSGNDSCWP